MSKVPKGPLQLALMMALAMAAGEVLEIFVFAALPPLPEGVEALLDALLLTIVATPFLYLLLVRPLSEEIQRRRTAEVELSVLNRKLGELNRNLEQRVEKRTADLAAANARLTKEIDEKRRAVDDAWRSHGFIQTVVESVPYLVMIYDVGARRCAFVNGRVVDLLGYDPEVVCAKGTDFFRETLDHEAYRSLRRLGETTADEGAVGFMPTEWRMKASGGQYRRLEVRASVLRRGPSDRASELLLTATEA